MQSYENIRNLEFSEFSRFRDRISLPFDNFFDELRRQGFIIGVDHYCRFQAILRKFGPHQKPSELKYLLCPIFAINQKQQELFYQAFDIYFNQIPFVDGAIISETGKSSTVEEEKAEPPIIIRKWVYFLAAIGLIIFIGLIAYRFYPKPAPVKTITITEFPVKDRKPNIKIQYEMSPAEPLPLTWYQEYGNALKTTAVLTPFVLLMLVELYLAGCRGIAIQRCKSKKPPFTYHIDVKPPRSDFLKIPQFYKAANQMRQRLEGDTFLPDIQETIEATIQNIGFTSFRYRQMKHPPEYIFLINTPVYNDHYSGFMDTVSKELENEGIYIHRYFFTDDPQICFNEIGGERLYLSDLKEKFSRFRLIIAGSCDVLLNPITGEIEPWTEMLLNWDDRAVLTPVSPSEWGIREVTVAKNFIILPATIDGLAAIVDCFETPVSPSLKTWVKSDDSLSAPFEKIDHIKNLRTYLEDENAFQWLCACAVYPELNWHLTLYLGMSQGNQITEKSLIRLIRLPWLRQGYIPDDLRLRLIAELEPERLRNIRQNIIEVMELDPPPADSAAVDSYRLNLASHKALAAKEKIDKTENIKEIKDGIKKIEENRIIMDYTLLKILESDIISPLAIKLPKRFNKIFFRNGIPLFGMRSWMRILIAVIIAIVIFKMMPSPEQPVIDKVGRFTMTFAHIPAGKFNMGSPSSELGRWSNDEMLHQVELTKDFYLQTTEVTQGQWKAVMGNNPSQFKCDNDNCDNLPVENVSWEDVQKFIERLNKKEGKEVYRLPTEAEWEYAARAGTQTAFANGEITKTGCENDTNLNKIGWYCGNSENRTHDVGQKEPNAWGLYDMHGNVWEWCQDWYGEYSDKFVVDPMGSDRGSARVIRGGSWYNDARDCRSAYRIYWHPGDRYDLVGFRLSRSSP